MKCDELQWRIETYRSVSQQQILMSLTVWPKALCFGSLWHPLPFSLQKFCMEVSKMRESRTKVAMKYNIIPDLCYPVLNIPSYLHLMYPYNHGHWFLFHRSSDAPSHSIGSSGMIFLCWHQSLHRSRLCIHSISVLQTPNISRIYNGKGIMHIVVQLGRVSVNPQDLCLK